MALCSLIQERQRELADRVVAMERAAANDGGGYLPESEPAAINGELEFLVKLMCEWVSELEARTC